MAGASEVADLFVTVRAITDPAIKSLTELGAAGERVATQIDAAMKTVTASIAKISESFKLVGTSGNEMATAVEADMTKIKASATGVSTEIAGPLEKGFTAAGASADKMATQVATAMKEVEASVAKAAESTKTVTSAGNEMAVAWEADLAKMTAATNKASADMAAAETKVAAGWRDVAVAEEAATAKASASAGAFGISKNALVGVAAATGVVAVESLKMAGNFQQATDTLVTTAGEDRSKLDEVRQAMLSLSSSTGTSAQEMVGAMYKIESSHIHAADAVKVLTAAVQGAKVENSGLKVTADALTTTMTDFHFKTDQAATVMSKLIAATGGGKLTMEEMASSLHSVENVAGNVHLSFDQMAAALATLTMHGQSADQATQNLRHAIESLAAPNAAQTKAMAGLGVNAQDLASKLGERGLSGTYKVLTDAIAAHTQGGKVSMDLMNTSAVAAEKAARMYSGLTGEAKKLADEYKAGNLTSGEYTKAIKTLGGDLAPMSQQFKVAQDRSHGFSDAVKSGRPDVTNFMDALKQVTGGTVGLGVALGLTGENARLFDENIKAVSGATAQADGNVAHWDDVQQRFNQKLDVAKESVKNLGISIGNVLIPAVSAILGPLASVMSWFSQNKIAADALAVVVGGALVLALAGLAVRGVRSLASLAMEFPKTLAAAVKWATGTTAASAEAEAADTAAGAAATRLATVTNAAATEIEAAYARIAAAAKLASGEVVAADAAAGVAAEGEAAATTTAMGESAVATEAAGARIGGAWKLLGVAAGAYVVGLGLLKVGQDNTGTSAKNLAQDAADTAGKLLTLDLGGIAKKIGRDWQQLPADLQTAKGRLSTAWDGIKGAFTGGESSINESLKKVKQDFQDSLTPIPPMLNGVMGGLVPIVNTGVHNIVAEVDKLSPLAKASLVQLAPAMREPTQAAVGGLLPIVTSGIQNIVNGIGLLPPHAQAILAPLPQAMQGPAQTALAGMLPIVTTGIDNITKAIGQAPPGATTALQPLPQALKNPTDTALGGMNTAVQTGLNKINQQFRKVGPDARTNVGDLSQTLQPAGQSAMSGFYQSMVNFYNSYIKPWLSSLASYIASLKGPVDKDRQLLVPHGTAIMAGLGEGLHTGFQKVIADVGTYSAQIRDAAAVNVPGAHLGSATGGGYNGVGGGGGSSYSASNANYYNSGGNTNYGATSNYANYQNSTGGGGDRDDGGGGGDMHFTFNGHVWDVEQLIREIQCRLQRHHIRNPTNGTSYVPTGTPATVITSTLSGPAQAGIC